MEQQQSVMMAAGAAASGAQQQQMQPGVMNGNFFLTKNFLKNFILYNFK